MPAIERPFRSGLDLGGGQIFAFLFGGVFVRSRVRDFRRVFDNSKRRKLTTYVERACATYAELKVRTVRHFPAKNGADVGPP